MLILNYDDFVIDLKLVVIYFDGVLDILESSSTQGDGMLLYVGQVLTQLISVN